MAEWAAKRKQLPPRALHRREEAPAGTRAGALELLDEAFEELYGTVPLTQKQKDYYIGKYLPFANPEFIKIARER